MFRSPSHIASGALVPVVAVLLTVAGCEPIEPVGGPTGTSAQAVAGYPSSMAALGDSITVAYGSCLIPSSCPRNSWATGNGTRVDSHYQRIAKANPSARGNARNYAKAGATAADLVEQARSATGDTADYVTILIGANDACRREIDEMTSASDFREHVDQALDVLVSALPEARILVVGIPDLYHLWEIGHTHRLAVAVWGAGICPALLANPTSGAQADIARRTTFQKQIATYNTQLADSCSSHGPHCRYSDAAYKTSFTLDMFNVEDFFHPNSQGQNKLADVTYPNEFTW